MPDPQGSLPSSSPYRRDGLAGRLAGASLFTRLLGWRTRHLLRLALRTAEEPVLVLELSHAPEAFWPVLLEHRNRIILSGSPASRGPREVEPRQADAVASRVRPLPDPADYTELQRGSVDCVLISLPQWREDSLETLAVLHRVTRDTVILFSGFDTQGAAAAETKPCNALRQALDAIGFTSIGHHRLTPVAGSPCVHILRKQGPEAQRLNH